MDINSDMGEIPRLLDDGTYSRLMDYVTSINICLLYTSPSPRD